LARPAFVQAWQRLGPDLEEGFDELKELLPSKLRVSVRA
jgi:hypothetical protein